MDITGMLYYVALDKNTPKKYISGYIFWPTPKMLLPLGFFGPYIPLIVVNGDVWRTHATPG
jgi:hypothetical protein